MMSDRTEQSPGARFLFILACLVVVVYGLKFAAPILVPSALALFLAVLSLPVMLWLLKHRVPAGVATLVTVLANMAVVVLLILLASQSVSEFQASLDGYVEVLGTRQESVINWLEEQTSFTVSNYLTMDLINPNDVVDFVGGTVGRIAQFLGTTFLVFLIMAFMLGEATVFPAKFHYVLGEDAGSEDRLKKVVTEVQTYLGIKTMVSLMTGLILGLWAYVMDLDFPLLLGLVAFVLNYVPTVGSILAAIPAVLISLVLFGTLPHAIVVAGGYVMVNTLFGNILEPSLMGRRLGLSTLVVILSLLFWGWAWGPLGALLSVPLTVVMKIGLENTQDLRWVAILLDKSAPSVPDASDAGLEESA
jgi:AI-2 transport protein TqsA